jgi:hypothetical protein
MVHKVTFGAKNSYQTFMCPSVRASKPGGAYARTPACSQRLHNGICRCILTVLADCTRMVLHPIIGGNGTPSSTMGQPGCRHFSSLAPNHPATPWPCGSQVRAGGTHDGTTTPRCHGVAGQIRPIGNTRAPCVVSSASHIPSGPHRPACASRLRGGASWPYPVVTCRGRPGPIH